MSKESCDRCGLSISSESPIPPLRRKSIAFAGHVQNVNFVCDICYKRWIALEGSTLVWLHEEDYGSLENEWAVDSETARKIIDDLVETVYLAVEYIEDPERRAFYRNQIALTGTYAFKKGGAR
jgi:hypothetical protein